jgi:RHS repeat-associated protein
LSKEWGVPKYTNSTFDSIGNLLTITKPLTSPTQIFYNSFNKPASIIDPLNNTSSLTYNPNANLTQINLPNSSSKHFTYYSNGLVNTYMDALGNTITYNYDSFGDLTSVISPSGTKSFIYDASGRLISQKDENSYSTTYQYNYNDMVTIVTDPLSKTVQYGFDDDNNLTSVIDKNGNLSNLTYDTKDRLISIQDPAIKTKTFAYDSRDNIVSTTDENSHTIQYGYDAKKRLISKTNSLGTTNFGYDPAGNRISETNATGQIKTFSYDSLNQQISIADALGNTTTFTYNSLGQISGMQDPMGRTTSYSYDNVGLMTGITDAASHSTTATYDLNGNRLTIKDANNHTQHFSYDASNRLGSYTDASGNFFSFAYDGVGNLITETKPTGTISRTYNPINKVTNVVNAGGDNYTYTFDANGNLLTSSNNTGASSFSYNNLNQLVQYSDVFGNNVYYTYDAVGNKKSIKYPGDLIVNYDYDNDNNLIQVTDWLGHSTAYNYDTDSRLTEMNYPNIVSSNFSYDTASRLISKSNTITSTIINQSIFTLDANGNRTQENRQGPTPFHLTASSFAFSYGLDDRLLSDSLTSYLNDGAGNRIGQTNSEGTTSYNFSVDNILNSIVTAANTSTYHYDANKNRVEKNDGSIVTRYVLDPSGDLSQVLQEQDTSGNVKAHYIYGLGLIARIDSANNILYYHYDAQHNTVALTNASAQVTDTYTYEPFGTLLTHTGNTQQLFTFLGEYGVQQETSSLYYIRARYYDSANGRFLSKDYFPASLMSPQTLNRYVYGSNNPLSVFDITGLYGNVDGGGNGLALNYIKELSINVFKKKLENVLEFYSSKWFIESLYSHYSESFSNWDLYGLSMTTKFALTKGLPVAEVFVSGLSQYYEDKYTNMNSYEKWSNISLTIAEKSLSSTIKFIPYVGIPVSTLLDVMYDANKEEIFEFKNNNVVTNWLGEKFYKWGWY